MLHVPPCSLFSPRHSSLLTYKVDILLMLLIQQVFLTKALKVHTFNSALSHTHTHTANLSAELVLLSTLNHIFIFLYKNQSSANRLKHVSNVMWLGWFFKLIITFKEPLSLTGKWNQIKKGYALYVELALVRLCKTLWLYVTFITVVLLETGYHEPLSC